MPSLHDEDPVLDYVLARARRLEREASRRSTVDHEERTTLRMVDAAKSVRE